MKKNEFLKVLANAGPAALAGLGLFMICMPTEWEYNSVNSLIGGSATLVGGTHCCTNSTKHAKRI